MKKSKKFLIEKEEVHSVICNMCGNEIGVNEFGYRHQHISIEKEWGFGSPYDGSKHNIDLCHDCYEKFIKTFKIQPNK